jgi:predicted nucleic acid-binding protein
VAAVLLDTSAIYAVLDADDDCHSAAVAGWDRLLDGVDTGGVEPLTHSGIVVETAALVQHRLGMPGAEALHRDLLPLVRVVWVDEVLHERAVAALLAAARREVSLVDWTSFELLRARALDTAFAFDRHFWEQGFTSWA